MHSQGEVYKVSMVPARRYSAPTLQHRGHKGVRTSSKDIILDVSYASLSKWCLYIYDLKSTTALKQGQNVNKTARTDYRKNRQTSKQANRKADKHT